jgi:hypothetical protein
MRLRRALALAALAALIAVAGAGAWLAWMKLTPRRTPEGQPVLARLDADTLPALREAFNAATGRKRVLALFSPT